MSDESEVDKLLQNTNLEYMLEFETQIFLDVIHKDGLVVAAKGVNLDLVVLNLLRVYCDPGNLILVINATECEEKYFKAKLDATNVHIINATSTNTVERQDSYLSGGIHFVTTRILVVDMLKKRLPIEKITGFVLLRAHRIFESCQEAFILRLYRHDNKTGFIKAFTNSPQSFTMGFGHVERVMRTIFVKELYIWPRFHSLISHSLKKYEPEVIELHIPISEKMKKIQTYILDLMNLTAKELKRINKTIELQEITVENCLTRKFQKTLSAQIDMIWHQLSDKSHQLISDLRTLRHLILTMLYSDSVNFFSLLSSYRTKEYAQKSTWVLLQPAELLFQQMNSLVFTGDKEFNPEFCPKWDALLEILKVEIPQEIKKMNCNDCTVLILCSDNKTCHQLNEVLTRGPHRYLFMLALKKKVPFKSVNTIFFKCNGTTSNITAEEDVHTDVEKSKTKKLKTESSDEQQSKDKGDELEDEKEEFQSTYILTMTQEVLEANAETGTSNLTFEPFTQMEDMNLTQLCESVTAPKILIQTFKGGQDYISLQNTLECLKPTFIIMYHSNITATREIEMYEAHRKKDEKLKVYFLIHAGTVEEQSYLTTLRREKEAFEFLIETKSKMVIPEDQDGKSDQCLMLQRSGTSPVKSTRQGGRQEETSEKQIIIVDMREFRSELPALIHKRGIEIEPVTITVGDYILTKEICIERKSLSDLIGSLSSGRLYQQCTQMFRYYTKPMLLIEFDQNKSFSWQAKNNYMLSSDGNNFDIQQKLLLLTIHFPKLKIIWSPSPYASAQLFEELKQGKEEPDVQYAAAIGGEDLDVIEAKYNSTVYDFVQKLPGITSKNIDVFLRNVDSLDNAVNKSEEELKEILGNPVDAKSLYSILHEEHSAKDDKELSRYRGKFKSKPPKK